MELSHLPGQRGRYASSDEQRHWQRQTSSLRTGVSVAEAAKHSSIASIGVNLPMPPPPPEEYAGVPTTTYYVGSIRFCGVGTWFLSGLRAEGCACSLDGGYSTKWIAYGSFRPFGSGRIVHGKGTPTCNPCSRCLAVVAVWKVPLSTEQCVAPRMPGTWCSGSLKVDFLSQGA